MISVDQALDLIFQHRPSRVSIDRTIENSLGCYLAESIYARVSQPPANVSAMDGYAVKLSDILEGQSPLKLIGESAAGLPFQGSLGSYEAIRVFTGAIIPDGADHVIIQEDVKISGEELTLTEVNSQQSHIREMGLDFKQGEMIVEANKLLGAYELSIIAAANYDTISVYNPYQVAVLTAGDELKPPGSSLLPGQIINSNTTGLCALIKKWGASPFDLGISEDSVEAIISSISNAPEQVDLFVAIGGASVGDYDYMRKAFSDSGFEFVFEKVAVKPGKPTWFAKRGRQVVLGLPGNPASALVCANLFLQPLLCGANAIQKSTARVDQSLPVNGARETYMRATAYINDEATIAVTPINKQDSSLINPFLTSNCLIRRAPHSNAVSKGQLVEIVMLDPKN